MTKIVTKLGFSYNGATMAIIKVTPDTGVLVWLDRNLAEYARYVTVRYSLGDEYAELRAYTVGNFYGLGQEKAKREFAVVEKQMYADFAAAGRTDYGRTYEVDDVRHCLESKCRIEAEEALDKEIAQVCMQEGIVTLLKHSGESPRVSGVEVKNLEKGRNLVIDVI